MKINKRTKIALIAAVIWSLLSLSFIMFAFSSGKNPYGPFTFIQCCGLAFYMIVSGLYIRAIQVNISFNFSEALKFSAIIGTTSSLVVLFIGYTYMEITWDTNFSIYIDNMTTFYTSLNNNGELEKIGEVDKEAALNNIELLKTATSWNIVFTDFSLKMVTSIVISFIIAIVMRKSVSEIEVK